MAYGVREYWVKEVKSGVEGWWGGVWKGCGELGVMVREIEGRSRGARAERMRGEDSVVYVVACTAYPISSNPFSSTPNSCNKTGLNPFRLTLPTAKKCTALLEWYYSSMQPECIASHSFCIWIVYHEERWIPGGIPYDFRLVPLRSCWLHVCVRISARTSYPELVWTRTKTVQHHNGVALYVASKL